MSADNAATHQDNVIPDDFRHESGNRWEISQITDGYRGVLRDTSGHAPVTLYGRTPGELAESIRMAGVSS